MKYFSYNLERELGAYFPLRAYLSLWSSKFQTSGVLVGRKNPGQYPNMKLLCMLAFPRPREISAILKHMISCIFISMCLECYLTLSRYHTQINLALEIYYLIMINAKDDVYTVCSLTLANKILIQNCLVTCCAVFEFIQHFSTEKARIKEIHAMNKYYMGWFLTVWYGYFQINWGLFSFPFLANPALTTENNNNNNNMFISHPLY